MTSTFFNKACVVTRTWKKLIAEHAIQKQNINERHFLWHYFHFR